IQRVDAVIPQLARAPVPEPVPVVVDEVVAILALGRGPLPEVVIQPAGNRRGLPMADGWPRIVVPTAREQHPTDLAATQALNGFNNSRHAAPLSAELNNPVMLTGRRDHHLAFAGIVAGGFLHIDVLAGGA